MTAPFHCIFAPVTHRMQAHIARKLLLLLSSFLFYTAQGQQKSLCPPAAGKKAEKYYQQAREARNDRKPFAEIKALCEKALEEDSMYSDALRLLGDAAWQSRNDKAMAAAYVKLLQVCPDASADAHYRLANYYYAEKSFAKAITFFESFLDFNKVKEENAYDASQKITRAKLMQHPVPFQPAPLTNVSTGDPEYLAIISPDQEICFFTRRFEEQKKGSLFPSSVEKFMVSYRKEDAFDQGAVMPPPFNKSGSNNEGGASITIDNKHLYFTVNKNGNFDIYTSDEVNGVWSEPRSVGPEINHPDRWDSQPCIAADGKTLYFVSIRDSVTRTSDIYVSKKDATGKWSAMKSIGAPINTEGSEKTPFIHPDNKTFYFSSDALPGMGGYDIYMSKLQSDGSWGVPVNLGYPINTEGNELGFFVSTDGRKGYFASDVLKGSGGYDIFEFDLPATVRPDRVLFIKGDLKDENNEVPQSAQIELKNAATRQQAEVIYDSTSGKYTSVVLFDDDYILTVKKQGYAYTSSYFSKEDSTQNQPKKVDLQLKKTEVGSTYRLENIHFDTESSSLTQQDQNIIFDFSVYLRENPSMKVGLYGHTDNVGDQSVNLKLSEARAKSVLEFLVAKGISRDRLSFKGFGSTKPVAPNDTPEGRAQNRRTEFVILSK